MSDSNEGAVRAYTDGGASRGVWVGGSEPAASSAPAATPAPSIADVIETTQNRVEGADLATNYGAGILATILDGHTADIVRGREPTDNDLCTVQFNSGREMRVRIRNAINEGFLFRDAHGKLHEADRASQQQAFNELQLAEQAQRQAGQVKYSDATEQAVANISDAMAADGLDFTMTLASFIGSDGHRLDEVTERWAAEKGLGDFRVSLQNYMATMRKAVIDDILTPGGIDAGMFLVYLQENRAKANAAAIRAHVAKDLSGFRELASSYRNSGWLAVQRRGF